MNRNSTWLPAALACAAALGCSQPRTAPGTDEKTPPDEVQRPSSPDPGDPADGGPAAPEQPAASTDADGAGPWPRITEAQRSVFFGSPDEPPPAKRFDDQHYVHSNEQHHELFFPYITDLGGGYVGVASDQNYTLAARARSEWIWLMDYDIVVVRMHRAVRALVLAAQTPAEYQDLWSKERKDEALAIIEKAYASDPELEQIKKVYTDYRAMTQGYNTRITTRAAKGKCAFWLSDPGSYEYMRHMFEADRIRALRGNLLESVTLRGIADAASKLGTKIEVVYLSDAESFFSYTTNFRDNFNALPMDESSVILRTAAGKVFKLEPGDYQWHYNVQSGLQFQGLLINDPPVPRVWGMLRRAKKTGVEGVSVTGIEGREAVVLSPAPAAVAPEPEGTQIGEDEPPPEPAAEAAPEPAAAAQPASGECGDVPDDMVCIPAGEFVRGADDSDPDRMPLAKVNVSAFLMERFEVTNEKFGKCIKAGACQKHESYKGFMGPSQPAVGITWYNASAYCAWAGRRLPTEAEWEKAARGPDGDLYPWGNEEPTCQRAHYRGCTPDTTLPVGSLPAGHYGLYDMAGNGYEWVQDWWAPCYDGCDGGCGEACTASDPKGPCDGQGAKCKGFKPWKVLRGGSWYWPASQIMSSWRRKYKMDSGEHRLSVRCALSISG